MTTFRGTVKDGQLVFPAEVAEQLGLREGDGVDVPEAALTAALNPASGNPFGAWIGRLPPLPDGQGAVSFTREMRETDESA